MAVAANDQQSRQGQAEFRSDHMDDALPAIVEPEQSNVLIGGIFFELADHARDFGIGNGLAAAARRHIVVGDAERQSRLGNRCAPFGKPAEGVKRAFVHIVAIDPQQALAVALHDFVARPEFVEEGQRRIHADPVSAMRGIAVERLYCMLNNT